jgi:hypothetical protein
VTLEEVKAIAPNAEIISLDPDAKYVIFISRASMPMAHMANLADALRRSEIHAVILTAIEPPLIYKVSE